MSYHTWHTYGLKTVAKEDGIGKSMELRLYMIHYYVWNSSFSKLVPMKRLSVGFNPTDAIARLRKVVSKDATKFVAEKVTNVLGHKIKVE